MGTTLSDASYALGPTGKARSGHRQERISQRWSEWTPLLTAEARKHADPAGTFASWHATFKSRVDDLLRADILWPTIVRNNLDDPRLCSAEFESLFSLARARRERHSKGTLAAKRRRHANKP